MKVENKQNTDTDDTLIKILLKILAFVRWLQKELSKKGNSVKKSLILFLLHAIPFVLLLPFFIFYDHHKTQFFNFITTPLPVLFSGSRPQKDAVLNQNQGSPPVQSQTNAAAEVSEPSITILVKTNNYESSKFDIYKKDDSSGKETFFTTVSDFYIHHYHGAEHRCGYVYLIVRPGGEMAYETNPNWTDELWRYDKNKHAEKVYACQGLDFRVSDDGAYVYIMDTNTDSSGSQRSITILNKRLEEICVVYKDELENKTHTTSLDPLFWAGDKLWLAQREDAGITQFIKLDPLTSTLTPFRAPKTLNWEDCALNPDIEKLAYSDYPILFDESSKAKIAQKKQPIHLYLYDLQTHQKKVLATSIAKPFKPEWLDAHTLIYTHPHTNGRVRISL